MFQSKNFLLYFSITAVTLVSGLIYFSLDHTSQSMAHVPQVKLHRKGKIMDNANTFIVFPSMPTREKRSINRTLVGKPSVKMGLRSTSHSHTLLKNRTSASVNALAGINQSSASIGTVGKSENTPQLEAQNFSNKPVSRAGLFLTSASPEATMQKTDGFGDPLDNPYEAPLKGGSFLIVLLVLYGFMKKIYRF